MVEPKNVKGNLEPVRKQLKVSLPVEASFRLFTEGIGRWWPLATHSVGEDQAETCFLEGWVGGRIVEVIKDGRQVEWGKVTVWEPFQRVSFHWYPGRALDTAQEVTVTFREVQGGTLVGLVHTGWETLGERALVVRQGYESGWEVVLAKYREASTQ
jgi:hypothetical protein